MKWPSKKVVRRELQSRLLAFCIGIAIIWLATVQAYCKEPKMDVIDRDDVSVTVQDRWEDPTLDDFDKAAVLELWRIAAATAQTLNVYMNDRVTDMLVWSELSGALRDAFTAPEARPDANRSLEKCLKLSGAYEAILLLDRSGICLASAPEGLVSKNFADNEAFKGAVNGKLTLVDFHKTAILTSLDPKSNGWTVTIAVPVKVENDVVGVLMSLVNWSRLEELVQGVKGGKVAGWPKPGRVFVLNKQNQTITHWRKGLYGVRLRDPQISLPELDDAITGRLPYCTYVRNPATIQSGKKLVGLAYPEGYGNFPGLGWVVYARMDQSETVIDRSSILKMLLRTWFFG